MKNRIYIKHWLELKPQNYSSPTDLYYLRIANDIHANFSANSLEIISEFMDKEDVCIFCCFLTCYFEDIISQTNIWQTFKTEYAKQYNKALPFYDKNLLYIDDEINHEDINFLIWYFLNSIQEDRFLNPYSPLVFNMASEVMQILDEAFEYAPENKKLKSFYELHIKVDEFYETRSFLQSLFFDTYLLYPDIKHRLTEHIVQLLEENSDEDPQLVGAYINEINDDFTFNQTSSILALKAKDWAMALLGKYNKHFETISSLSMKVKGLFFYKWQNEHVVCLEHIASSMLFEVSKKSFDNHENLSEDNIIFIGLVKYNNEWWFSGNFSISDFDGDIVLDQKNSASARADVNFLEDKDKFKEVIELQKRAFLDYNDNSLIAFIKQKDLNTFINDYMTFFNDSLQISNQEKKNASERAKADGYFGSDTDFNTTNDGEEPIVVFFNPVSGIEMLVDIVNAFPDSRNPFFTEESYEDVQHILMAENCSTELAHYLIDNYKDQLSYFEKEPYKSYLNDLDFLLKFWKKENYETKPTIVLTGENE